MCQVTTSPGESNFNFMDARTFYRYANTRLSGYEQVTTLKTPASLLVTASEKANFLANHFAEVFSRDQCPRSARRPFTSENESASLPDTAIVFTEEIVSKHLAELSSKTSFTPESIPPMFLKTFNLFLAEPLASICQRPYTDGSAPALFRCGVLIPDHKKGSKEEASNYRPVSQYAVACFVFEKILSPHMFRYLSLNNLYDPDQHGFVARKSTCTQLLNMIQDFGEFINRRIPYHSIYFDLMGAFDKVNHDILLEKMCRLGLYQKTITWCRSYLSNRSFRVRVEGELSFPLPAPSGIPQGDSLSPFSL